MTDHGFEKESGEINNPIQGGLPKLATGLRGLDQVLSGGIPRNRTTIIRGGSGVGKSVLCLELLARFVRIDIPVIYISFEEQTEDIIRNASTMGRDLKREEDRGLLFLHGAQVNHKVITSGDYDNSGLKAIIGGQAEKMGAQIVILDALDVLLDFYQDPRKRQAEVYDLNNWLGSLGLTTVLTVKSTETSRHFKDLGFLEFLADCVIHLEQTFDQQMAARRFWVAKYRGSGHLRHKQPFVISERGFEVLPKIFAPSSQSSPGAKVSMGQPRLDELLNGGVARSSSVLIAGVTGAGKTALACTFVRAACRRNEKVLFLAYEESPETMMKNVRSLGIDLGPAVKDGRLNFISLLPETLGAEEHLLLLSREIEKHQPDHIIVDAVSACKRMGPPHVVSDYLIRLMNLCKHQGITTVLLNQIQKMTDLQEVTGVEISSLIDTIIFLGMVDRAGEINRLLVVTKSRGAPHSNQYHELVLSDNGLELTDVYVGQDGVLTGTAKKLKIKNENAESLYLRQLIANKEMEVNRKNTEMQVTAAKIQTEIDTIQAELKALHTRADLLAGRELDLNLKVSAGSSAPKSETGAGGVKK